MASHEVGAVRAGLRGSVGILGGLGGCQLGIDWTPAGRELARSLRRRDGKRARMLARLQAGPATTWELMQIGGSGFSSRLAELKKEGHRIVAEGGPDAWVYRLEC